MAVNGHIRTLTRAAKTGAYHPTVWGNRLALAVDGRPLFTWLEAERMRYDPQVQFGLRILRAPLYGVTWKVHADSAAAERWIERELAVIYRRMLPMLCRHFEYGIAAGEVTYKVRKQVGRTRVHFGDFLEVHPRDAIPRVYDYGPRSGQLACLTVKGASTGFGGVGEVTLDRRHSFWFKGDSEFGNWFGRARLAGAHQPWFDKGARHGANDSIRLFYKKQAFKGPSLFYPPGMTDQGTPENPILRSNQDIAREIVEKFENGGVLAIPNALDDKGQPLWRWEDPKSYADLTGLLDYKKSLDRDILVGLGIPPELVDAATVGSGYSGRAIPAQVFFSSMDEESQRIIDAIDRSILRGLVKLNFSHVGYAIKIDSLAQLVAREASGAGGGAPTTAAPGGASGPPSGPHEELGPRGGHRLIGANGKMRYGSIKPRVKLSLTAADTSVSPAEARRLWDAATGPEMVTMGTK